ncbi:uncharacterized protein FRV6_15732 [Fusarium oxysporum]|uniref:Zn(2)-C6 fungal-type domain-containing protein n=1 Tax=Fusarium oxysporum TaxID=5507 RepID=A0A2H3TSK5_FUSOX|nr:uncharacterized protein FRV6_15732 [Fusarium oxysporum]
MHGSPSMEGPSKAESGPSEQPQYSSHNYSPSNSPPGVRNPHFPHYGTINYQLPPPPPPIAPYTPPPSSTSTPYAYPLGGAYFNGLRPGTAPVPRQRTSIACRYCRKRKIRCSGRGTLMGGKCVNCSRMNQECIFSDVTPAPAIAPSAAAPGVVPLREGAFGSLRQPVVQEAHQNRDINSFEYGVYSMSHQQYYPQSFYPPAPDHRGVSHHDRRLSYGQTQYDSDSHEDYEVLGKLQSLQANSELKGDDCDVSNPWMSHIPKRSHNFTPDALAKHFETLQGRERQARPPSILDLPHSQDLELQDLEKTREILRENDRKPHKLGKTFEYNLEARLRKQPQVSKESIELPDAAGLTLRSRTPSASPTVSSDIEVASISEDSDAVGQLDVNSQGYRIFSRVFCRIAILGQNEVTERGESSSNSSKGKQVAKGGSTSSSSTRDGTSSTRGRKNQRQDDDLGDEAGDGKNEPPSKRGKTSQSQCGGRSRFLACPYWKSDPEKYWECFLKKNDTIAHLKQHLTRRHTPKYYCQICYETFGDFDLFDSHALERSCTRGPSAKLEGISQQQKNQLSIKSKGSVEQQWYTVWSILFPDLEPPATIYIHSTHSEDFCRIQEFAQREGVAIMLDELESNGLVVQPDASNQMLRSTVQRAMVAIFRSYSIRREPSSEEAEEPILSQALEPDHGVSLQQVSITGGQIGHGNLPINSTDMNRMMEDVTDGSIIERSNRPSRSTWSQLPMTASWLPRGIVQDHNEDEPWGPAFLDEPAFGQSSSGNDLPFTLESSDMSDLDALLRDVISTEA